MSTSNVLNRNENCSIDSLVGACNGRILLRPNMHQLVSVGFY